MPLRTWARCESPGCPGRRAGPWQKASGWAVAGEGAPSVCSAGGRVPSWRRHRGLHGWMCVSQPQGWGAVAEPRGWCSTRCGPGPRWVRASLPAPARSPKRRPEACCEFRAGSASCTRCVQGAGQGRGPAGPQPGQTAPGQGLHLRAGSPIPGRLCPSAATHGHEDAHPEVRYPDGSQPLPHVSPELPATRASPRGSPSCPGGRGAGKVLAPRDQGAESQHFRTWFG